MPNLMYHNNGFSVAEFSILATSRSNSSPFSSGVHAILSMFWITQILFAGTSCVTSLCPWIGPNLCWRNQELLWASQASLHSCSYFVVWWFSLCSSISCCINCKYSRVPIVVGSSVGSSIVLNPISDTVLCWLRSAVLVVVGLEHW